MIVKILRALGKFVFSILFSLLLVSSLLVMSVANFTEFGNLNKIVGSLISGQLTSGGTPEEISAGLLQLKELCASSETKSISLSGSGEDLTFDCSQVENLDESNVGAAMGGQILEKIYYKEYGCDFLSCVTQSEKPSITILFSKNANDFFKQIQIYVWIATAVIGGILFFLIETWSGRLRSFGINFIFVGLPFFVMNYFKGKLLSAVPEQFVAAAGPLLDSLFKPVEQIYMIMLVGGVILVVASFVVKYKIENAAKSSQIK